MAIPRRRVVAASVILLLLLGASAAHAGTVASRLGTATLRHLPSGLGTPTDFGYHFARVDFTARVWESGSDRAGWRVDLDVVLMSGARLRTRHALHEWLPRYEQTADARYRRVRVAGRTGWAARDQVFWLVRPGTAVSVRLDRRRWSRRELFRTARGVRLSWMPRWPLMTETGTRSSLAW